MVARKICLGLWILLHYSYSFKMPWPLASNIVIGYIKLVDCFIRVFRLFALVVIDTGQHMLSTCQPTKPPLQSEPI